ncbi:MAG TPA: substrate-binding domain-containing protein [Gammaproteobacteria bacterium]|nr:substrate-binding domain-containing protein [Gammaproteobacteria bacterium]
MTLAAVRYAAALGAALVWLGAAAAQGAAPLRALSSNGVRAALELLVPQCERNVGRAVAIDYGTSASIRQRIGDGEAVDVAFVTREVLAALSPSHVESSSVAQLGRAGIGVGIRAGAHRYDIRSANAIKQALLAAKSVTYAQDGASRVHIERMFEQLGITAEMKAKTLLEQGSVRAAAKVVNGEAELLLTLVSEILPVEGMALVGPLPAEFQSYISFAGFVSSRPNDPAAARAFLACVAAPANASTFAAKGIER